MKSPMVFLSKQCWEPGMSGVKIAFSIGDKAHYKGKDGKVYNVVIKSDLMEHNDAPGLVREAYMPKSPYGPETIALDADRFMP